jgi:uncharacterized protein (DUF488 family)
LAQAGFGFDIRLRKNRAMPTIYTVGHGARSIDDFLSILQEADIQVLVDVRRYPGSRRHPHFGREPLSGRLLTEGIRYEWWGEALGGRRALEPGSADRHGAWEDESFRAYAAHMETSEFRKMLSDLIRLAGDNRVAIMCAESLWWRCHRRLIADAAVVAGSEVVHLQEGKRQPHELTPWARVENNGALIYDKR